MMGPQSVAIKEFEVPDPAPGALVVAIDRSNVCGSDVHIFHWESPALREAALGHEFVGRIHALGDGVDKDYAGRQVSVGDRVAVVYFLACRRCAGCRRGDFSLCANALATWSINPDQPPHFRGGFATHYYVEREQAFYKVPDSVSNHVAAGANCGLAQVIFVADKVGLNAGETLVVQGAGGLGLYATAVAKDRGARVIVIDGIDDRLELATKFGADHVISMRDLPDVADRAQLVQSLSDGGADVVLEVTGVARAFVEAIELAAVGGRIASVGNLNVGSAHEVTLAPALITRKHLVVHGILRYDPWYLERALAFLERSGARFPFEEIGGHDFSLDEVTDALNAGSSRTFSRPSIVP